MHRPRSRVIVVGRAVLVLVAAGALVHPGSAAAQEGAAASLVGYQGTAQADGLHVLYNPAGLLPIGPPLDLGAPDAKATIASGPATFARASAADPGDLLANPDALFQTGVSGWKPGTIPAYPYRATASSATQPHDESSPGPGLDARADADSEGSSATATMPASSTPAIATAGTMSSTATTTFDGSTVTVHARSELSDLNVLGLVTIGSVVTDLTAVSDGTQTTVSGGTVVSDALVLGTPVEIDAGGVEPAPGATTTTNPISGLLGSVTGSLSGSLNDVLAQAGLHLTVAGPVQQSDDQAGLLQASGLRIDFELSDQTFPALRTLFDALPVVPNPVPGAPGVGDLVAVAKARHLVSLEVGRGMVSLSARAFTPAARPSTSAPPRTTAAAAATVARPTLPNAVRPSPSGGSPAVLTPAPALVVDAPASVPIGAGIGALALLVLILQPFLGDGIARGVLGVLADDQIGSCPLEER